MLASWVEAAGTWLGAFVAMVGVYFVAQIANRDSTEREIARRERIRIAADMLAKHFTEAAKYLREQGDAFHLGNIIMYDHSRDVARKIGSKKVCRARHEGLQDLIRDLDSDLAGIVNDALHDYETAHLALNLALQDLGDSTRTGSGAYETRAHAQSQDLVWDAIGKIRPSLEKATTALHSVAHPGMPLRWDEA